MKVNPIPDGFHTVTPYLVIEHAEKVIEFLKAAFNAELISSSKREDGGIMHATVKIGNSMIMLAGATETYKSNPTMIYLYVEDTDAAYNAAMKAGATSIMAPVNQFYGDRNAGVKDIAGNQWWIATHVENVSDEELKRRHDEYMSKQKA